MSLELTKAMILAAGQGKRLWPLTSSVAKSALPLLGRPLVEYILRSLKRNGFREVVVNLHHQFESVESSLRGAPQELVVHRSFEPQLLGTAGGLKRAAQYFQKDETFLLVNADTLVGVDINQIIRAHYDSNALATLLLRPKVSGDRYSEIVLDDSGFVSAKNPPSAEGELMFSGTWVFSSSVFDYLSGRSVGLEEELLPRLIMEKQAFGCIQDCPWLSIDTPRGYWSASLKMVRQRLFQEDWCAELKADYLYGVGGNSHIAIGENTSIDHGVVLNEVVVLGTDCLIGEGAFLENVVCWNRVEIPPKAKISNCVLTDGVCLPDGISLSNQLVMRVSRNESGFSGEKLSEELVSINLSNDGGQEQ